MAYEAYYPTGSYWATIVDHGISETDFGGTQPMTPQMFIKFEVLGQVNPTDKKNFIAGLQRYPRKIQRSLTDEPIESSKNKGRLRIDAAIDDMEAIGFRGTSFAEFDRGQSSFQDFVGNSILVRCWNHTGKDGNAREDWFIDDGTTAEVERVSAEGVDKLDQLFGRALKDRMRGKEAPAADKPAPVEPEYEAPVDVGRADLASETAAIGDDDIPF